MIKLDYLFLFLIFFFLYPLFDVEVLKKKTTKTQDSYVLQKSLKEILIFFPFGGTFQIFHRSPTCKTFIILMTPS